MLTGKPAVGRTNVAIRDNFEDNKIMCSWQVLARNHSDSLKTGGVLAGGSWVRSQNVRSNIGLPGGVFHWGRPYPSRGLCLIES